MLTLAPLELLSVNSSTHFPEGNSPNRRLSIAILHYPCVPVLPLSVAVELMNRVY